MNPPAPKLPRDRLPLIYWGVFVVCLALGGLIFFFKREPNASIPVLTRDVPSYHFISASDVMTKTIDVSDVTTDTVRDAQNLMGHYVHTAITADQPIHKNQIVAIPDPALITPTLAVAIPASSATVLGGSLQAGDQVILSAVPLSDTAPASIIFDQVLVLDVKPNDKDPSVVLGIPVTRWQEYLDKTRNAQIVLARRVQ